MSGACGEKRIRALTLEEAFSPCKRARTHVVLMPAVEWLDLFPELLDLIARQCWDGSRSGIDDLKKANGTKTHAATGITMRHISKFKMNKGLSKLRIALALLNAFALVCRTWWAAVPWAEIWRSVHPLYHAIAPIKCNRVTMGPYAASPEYHAMLCGLLAVPRSKRHYLRTRRALEPEIRMAMDKFRDGGGGGDSTWWVSYHHFPNNGGCGYNEEIFRPGLSYVPTIVEQITSYWDYEVRKWVKPDAETTTIAKIRQQEQWFRKCEAALRQFIQAAYASKTSPPMTIPSSIDEQLAALEENMATVSERLRAGTAVRRIRDCAVLQALLSDAVEAMMCFETALDSPEARGQRIK